MILVKCPNCDIYIEVLQLNCKIFRCGILKNNGSQINPHLPKSECDKLFNSGKIFGCSKPFKIIEKKSENGEIDYSSEICGYI
jgi:hypothetical protein